MPLELTQDELDKKIADAIAEATKGLKDNRDDILGQLDKSKKALAKIEADKKAELESAEQEKLKSEGKLEELIARLRETHATEVLSLQNDNKTALEAASKADKSLRALMVDKGLSDGFMAAGVTNKDLLAAAVALNKGSAEIVDGEDGTPVVKVDGKPMEEFFTAWAEGQGKAFIEAKSSGGGAGGGGNGGGTDDYEKYFKGDTVNHTKQNELKNSDPVRWEALDKQYNKQSNTPLPLSIRG